MIQPEVKTGPTRPALVAAELHSGSKMCPNQPYSYRLHGMSSLGWREPRTPEKYTQSTGSKEVVMDTA